MIGTYESRAIDVIVIFILIGFTDIRIIVSAKPSFSPVKSTVKGSLVISLLLATCAFVVTVSEKFNIDFVFSTNVFKFVSSPIVVAYVGGNTAESMSPLINALNSSIEFVYSTNVAVTLSFSKRFFATSAICVPDKIPTFFPDKSLICVIGEPVDSV